MRLKIVFCLALLSFYIPIATPKVKAQEAIRSLDTSQLNQRPNRNNPTEVKVGIYLIDFDNFDEQNDSFKIDSYLFLTWQDRRLAFNTKQSKVNVKTYKLGEIWTPNIKFFNTEFARDTAYIQLQVKPDGTVLYKERFTATFNSEMNLKKFPFDSQNLKLVLEAVDDANTVKFALDKPKTGISAEAFFTGWKIQNDRALIRNKQLEIGESNFYQEFIYEIDVARSSNYYIWNILLPLLFIVLVSWAVFWSKSFESNTVISFSSLLSAIAFSIVIAEELPKVAYVTYINGFILLIYIFICLSIVQIVIKHCLELEKNREGAIKLDIASRWIFPTTFGISNLLLILMFLL